jgi:hypothetical protein
MPLETLMALVATPNSHLKPGDLRDWLLEHGFAVERHGELIPTSRTRELVAALRPTSTAVPRIRPVDDEATAQLLAYARLAVGREHGLDDNAARRLTGASVDELHADAASYARQLGIVDPSVQSRDGAGRFTGSENKDYNEIIRAASGR